MTREVRKLCRRMRGMEEVVIHLPASLVVEAPLMTSLVLEETRATVRERHPREPT